MRPFEVRSLRPRTAKTKSAHTFTDAIAAEKSCETPLNGFAKEAEGTEAASLFAQHATETQEQYERLTGRLENLGSSPSSLKSLLPHVFNFAPKAAQLGHDSSEKLTQNLMMAR
jgi:ferritin-like metal-binding protein YciE